VSATYTHCRHCKRPVREAKAVRRGLCWGCRQSPDIRALHPPPWTIFAGRPVTGFSSQAALGEPTEAMPGTPEKVAVLEARAAAGLSLWHPEDGLKKKKGGPPDAA
jgi:hypothetical protein